MRTFHQGSGGESSNSMCVQQRTAWVYRGDRPPVAGASSIWPKLLHAASMEYSTQVESAAGSARNSAVPSDPVAARAFLHLRVRLYLGIGLMIWLLALVTDGAIAYFGAHAPVAPHLPLHSLVVVALGVTFFWLRSAKPSVATLRTIEVCVSVLQATLSAIVVGQLPLAVRPEMMVVFAGTLLMMLRAGLVPSSARMALAVGALVMCPSIILTVWLYRTHAPIPGGLDANTALAYTIQWVVIALIATTAIHAVIYGLRERVQELGQYTLLQRIGAGGMGVVYRARHSLLRRPTAVKVLPIERMTPTGIARFEREVQLTAELAHPNIVSVYDFGRSPDGSFYYAMEFLDGIDLQRMIEETGPLPEARAVHFMLQAADALAEAHSVELIHRDIKPANLLVSNHPRRPDHLTVLDFGLAKTLGDSDAALSDVHNITGSPLYMSPESISEPANVDARSDLYGLGAVLYWLLTGTAVFAGSTVIEVCASHLHKPVESPSTRLGRPITPELERLVLECLAKDRHERPASADAMLERLRALPIARWDAERSRQWWTSRAPASTANVALGLTRTLAIASRSDQTT
jgi:eukaryotic-like serine/threonine-protein kinase